MIPLSYRTRECSHLWKLNYCESNRLSPDDNESWAKATHAYTQYVQGLSFSQGLARLMGQAHG